MRMRIGFIMGFGAGYVLGTSAGRERFEQMKEMAHKLSDSPQAQDLKQRATETFGHLQRTLIGDQRLIRLDEDEQIPASAKAPLTTAAALGDL